MSNIGEASFILVIEIIRDRSRELLGLSQRSVIGRVLKRFNTKNYSPSEASILRGDDILFLTSLKLNERYA